MFNGDITGYGATFSNIDQSRNQWAVYGEIVVPP
jgi:hypothetical protein